MSNTESISSRFRRWADESKVKGWFTTTAAGNDFGINCVSKEDERELFRKLADEIEAEERAIYEAQEGIGGHVSPHHVIKTYADGIGKPMLEHENITRWLDRWYLPRPVDTDGEPLEIGARYRNGSDTASVKLRSYTLDDDGSCRVFLRGFPGCRYGESDKRLIRVDDVLDADGVPIRVGDTVWDVKTGKGYEVVGVNHDEMTVSVKVDGFKYDLPSIEHLTHREPDTQERIDADARKDYTEYWHCGSALCSDCPAVIDGKLPRDRYDCVHCGNAQRLDLLRRQRELDGREWL